MSFPKGASILFGLFYRSTHFENYFLTSDFEGPEQRHARIPANARTIAAIMVEVGAATAAQTAATIAAQRPRW